MFVSLRLLGLWWIGAFCVVHAADNSTLAVKSAEATGGRVALVIGNAAYGGTPLANPVNDARAIASKLERLGFRVVKRENITSRQIGSTLREFRSHLNPGAEALFFYAGHGLQIKGVNYLPAVDADITSEEDVPNQSINVSHLLEIMDDTKSRLNLIFLDACRNNPFTRRFRSAGRGLAKIEAPSGTKISFATRPGSVAADGEGSNGLYTEYLLRVMDEPGLSIEQALKKVYSGVKQASKGAQEPWEEGTIEGEFYFLAAPKHVISSSEIKRLRQEAGAQSVEENAELQKALKAQREATDQAVQEALRKSKEEAARDRAELQASMEKILKDALKKQNEMLEAERSARLKEPLKLEPTQKSILEATEVTVQRQPPAADGKPVQLTSLQPSRPIAGSSTEASVARARGEHSIGDEWEYVAMDNTLGKKRTLVERVIAVAENQGVMEEFLLNGEKVGQWVSDGRPALIGISGDIGPLFTSHWRGGDIDEVAIANWALSKFASITARGKFVGKEKITVPAGTFDTTRIEIFISIITNHAASADIVIWYSDLHHHVVRQRGNSFGSFGSSGVGKYRFDDTFELSAIRRAAR